MGAQRTGEESREGRCGKTIEAEPISGRTCPIETAMGWPPRTWRKHPGHLIDRPVLDVVARRSLSALKTRSIGPLSVAPPPPSHLAPEVSVSFLPNEPHRAPVTRSSGQIAWPRPLPRFAHRRRWRAEDLRSIRIWRGSLARHFRNAGNTRRALASRRSSQICPIAMRAFRIRIN